MLSTTNKNKNKSPLGVLSSLTLDDKVDPSVTQAVQVSDTHDINSAELGTYVPMDIDDDTYVRSTPNESSRSERPTQTMEGFQSHIRAAKKTIKAVGWAAAIAHLFTLKAEAVTCNVGFKGEQGTSLTSMAATTDPNPRYLYECMWWTEGRVLKTFAVDVADCPCPTQIPIRLSYRVPSGGVAPTCPGGTFVLDGTGWKFQCGLGLEYRDAYKYISMAVDARQPFCYDPNTGSAFPLGNMITPDECLAMVSQPEAPACNFTEILNLTDGYKVAHQSCQAQVQTLVSQLFDERTRQDKIERDMGKLMDTMVTLDKIVKDMDNNLTSATVPIYELPAIAALVRSIITNQEATRVENLGISNSLSEALKRALDVQEMLALSLTNTKLDYEAKMNALEASHSNATMILKSQISMISAASQVEKDEIRRDADTNLMTLKSLLTSKEAQLVVLKESTDRQIEEARLRSEASLTALQSNYTKSLKDLSDSHSKDLEDLAEMSTSTTAEAAAMYIESKRKLEELYNASVSAAKANYGALLAAETESAKAKIDNLNGILAEKANEVVSLKDKSEKDREAYAETIRVLNETSTRDRNQVIEDYNNRIHYINSTNIATIKMMEAAQLSAMAHMSKMELDMITASNATESYKAMYLEAVSATLSLPSLAEGAGFVTNLTISMELVKCFGRASFYSSDCEDSDVLMYWSENQDLAVHLNPRYTCWCYDPQTVSFRQDPSTYKKMIALLADLSQFPNAYSALITVALGVVTTILSVAHTGKLLTALVYFIVTIVIGTCIISMSSISLLGATLMTTMVIDCIMAALTPMLRKSHVREMTESCEPYRLSTMGKDLPAGVAPTAIEFDKHSALVPSTEWWILNYPCSDPVRSAMPFSVTTEDWNKVLLSKPHATKRAYIALSRVAKDELMEEEVSRFPSTCPSFVSLMVFNTIGSYYRCVTFGKFSSAAIYATFIIMYSVSSVLLVYGCTTGIKYAMACKSYIDVKDESHWGAIGLTFDGSITCLKFRDTNKTVRIATSVPTLKLTGDEMYATPDSPTKLALWYSVGDGNCGYNNCYYNDDKSTCTKSKFAWFSRTGGAQPEIVEFCSGLRPSEACKLKKVTIGNKVYPVASVLAQRHSPGEVISSFCAVLLGQPVYDIVMRTRSHSQLLHSKVLIMRCDASGYCEPPLQFTQLLNLKSTDLGYDFIVKRGSNFYALDSSEAAPPGQVGWYGTYGQVQVPVCKALGCQGVYSFSEDPNFFLSMIPSSLLLEMVPGEVTTMSATSGTLKTSRKLSPTLFELIAGNISGYEAPELMPTSPTPIIDGDFLFNTKTEIKKTSGFLGAFMKILLPVAILWPPLAVPLVANAVVGSARVSKETKFLESSCVGSKMSQLLCMRPGGNDCIPYNLPSAGYFSERTPVCSDCRSGKCLYNMAYGKTIPAYPKSGGRFNIELDAGVRDDVLILPINSFDGFKPRSDGGTVLNPPFYTQGIYYILICPRGKLGLVSWSTQLLECGIPINNQSVSNVYDGESIEVSVQTGLHDPNNNTQMESELDRTNSTEYWSSEFLDEFADRFGLGAIVDPIARFFSETFGFDLNEAGGALATAKSVIMAVVLVVGFVALVYFTYKFIMTVRSIKLDMDRQAHAERMLQAEKRYLSTI